MYWPGARGAGPLDVRERVLLSHSFRIAWIMQLVVLYALLFAHLGCNAQNSKFKIFNGILQSKYILETTL